MKRCNKCGDIKSIQYFSKNITSKYGLQRNCKECNKLYREENKEKVASTKKKCYQNNIINTKNNHKMYYSKNKSSILVKVRDYRENNKELIAKTKKECYLKKPHVYAAQKARYRSSKYNSTPSWLSDLDIACMREFYEIASMFKSYTGLEYHVDHIVPLQGKTVCGLHVPWNLQVLPAADNIRKSNKLEEQ